METEILRGAKIRVTTQAASVGGKTTPIADIAEAAFVEADHRIALTPRILLVAGPIAGAALYIATLSLAIAFLAGVAIMTVGVLIYRRNWLHHVSARLKTGASTTLFRTSNKGDALLFHAAVEKALELQRAE